MPQLIPFYFVNQISFLFVILVVLVYVFSKYILPKFILLFSARVYLNKI